MAPPACEVKSTQLSNICLRLVVGLHPITIGHIPRIHFFKRIWRTNSIFFCCEAIKFKSQNIINSCQNSTYPLRYVTLQDPWRYAVTKTLAANHSSPLDCEVEPPWIDLTGPAHPTDAQLYWELGNLEAKAIPLSYSSNHFNMKPRHPRIKK